MYSFVSDICSKFKPKIIHFYGHLSLISSYGASEEIVDDWTRLFVQVLNRKAGEKVERPSKVKLIN